MADVPQVTLPTGWSVTGYRETSQANTSGRIVQGVVFTLSQMGGGITSVFVPYDVIGQTAAIQEAFDQRIAAITSVTGS